MQELQRRVGAFSGPATGVGADPLAPGRKTLVDALPFVPPPRAADDEVARNAPADPQAAPDVAAAEGAAPASGPLGAAETAAAIQFHTAQPWKYTKAVITDIQGAVGTPATGLMNAATVQAIAARQAAVNAERKPTPPLQVDGKAGPRTLPILKQVGLATDASIDTYTDHIVGMKDELDKATPAKRAELLMKEINARLSAAGVPQITKPVVFDGHLNAFSADTWTMTMSEIALADPKNAATTMYHEARHAEQSFRIARMLAGKKRSAAQITAEASIEATVAEQAVGQPLAPGTTEAVEAEGWHEDEVGRPPRAEKQAKSKVVFDEFLAAARAFNKEPTPANRTRAVAAYEAWKDVYYVHDYRDRPHEYDAFFVGEKVGDKLGVAREGFLPFDEIVKKIPAE
jgi:hypothetical protein